MDRTHTSPRGFTTQHLIKMSSFVRAAVESCCPLSGGCIVTDGAYEHESSARHVFGFQFSPLLKFCFIICLQDFNLQKFLLEVRISSNLSLEIIHQTRSYFIIHLVDIICLTHCTFSSSDKQNKVNKPANVCFFFCKIIGKRKIITV